MLDDESAEDFQTSERVSGKGSVTRYRTVVTEEGGDEDALRNVDDSVCIRGRVLSAIGLHCFVRSDDGLKYECTVRNIVKKLATDERTAVVAGDQVLIQPLQEEKAVIERVEPRERVISRGSKRREHVIVSNVDQAVIVASTGDPPLKTNLVDRFLISAEKGNVQPIICLNKVDLITGGDNLVGELSLGKVAGLYSQLGYDVVLTSAATGRGIEELRQRLAGKQTVFTGQSGVGKSSLLNAIQPGLELDTGEVSEESGKGTHTTRTASLLELDFGGWVVDTPGIRQLELWDVIPEEVEGYFVEFRPFVTFCHFTNCSHTHEDKCAVKAAVNLGQISRLRYGSYVRLLDVE